MATGTTNRLWFVPFSAREAQALTSVYDPPPAKTKIAVAQAFTVSLETVMIGKRPPPDLWSAITSRRRDIMVTSSAYLGFTWVLTGRIEDGVA